jgi:hypothetical protein
MPNDGCSIKAGRKANAIACGGTGDKQGIASLFRDAEAKLVRLVSRVVLGIDVMQPERSRSVHLDFRRLAVGPK